MKKDLLTFIFFWIAVAVILMCLFTLAQADVYVVPNFRGGMNLQNDSTDLAPNEALSIKNMEIVGNTLISRHGFSVWNDSGIVPLASINDCFVFQPAVNTYRLVISSGHYVYVRNNLTDIGDADWNPYALNYSDTGTVSADTLFLTSNIWSRMFVRYGDSVYLECSPDSDLMVQWSSGVPNNPNDTTIILNKSTPFTDSTKVYFEIWPYFLNPRFSQYKNKLYICDTSLYTTGAFALVYDDTNYQTLGIIDTGTVTDTIAVVDTPTTIYSAGYAIIGRNDNVATGYYRTSGGDGSMIADWSNVTTAMMFKITRQSYIDEYGPFVSKITAVSSETTEVNATDSIIAWHLDLEDIFLPGKDYQANYSGTYAITSELMPCGFADYALEDSTKDWNDVSHADEFLTSFYIQPSNSDTIYDIYCNSAIYALTNGVINPETRYYIYSMLPYELLITNNDYDQFPHLFQILFNHGRLWAIGNQYSRYYVGSFWLNKRGNVNLIWYSDPDYPGYIRYNYNMMLGNNEQLSCLFELRGEIYAASANAIWRWGGSPDDAVYKVSNIGFNSSRKWVNASNNYGYFVNNNGIYQWQGAGDPQLISQRVQAFHDKYKNSNIVLGYFQHKLYVSYPDSDVTLVYDEDYNAFTYFSFGMSFIMTDWADIDTSIFLFGHPDYPGYIFYYPDSNYTDVLPSGSAAFTCDYVGGNQSYYGAESVKQIEQVALPIQSSGAISVLDYADFDTAACASFVADSTNNYFYRGALDNNCAGRYHKIKITTSAGQKVVVRPYKVVFSWYEN